MTVAQMLRRFRQSVAYDLDPLFGPYPEGGTEEERAAWDEDAIGFLNEAAVELSHVAFGTADAVPLTLSPGVGTYPLHSPAFSRRMIQPYSVVVAGRRLTDPSGEFGLWSIDELTRRYPTWATDAPGEVRRAAFRGDRLILHPAPLSGGTATVEGRVGPAPFSLAHPDAIPELPERLHPGVVGYAVYRACKDLSQNGGQMSRLAAMREEALATAVEVGREGLNAQNGNPTRVFPSAVEEMRL